MDLTSVGWSLIALGILAVLAGVVLLLVGRLPAFGGLPGDILFQRDGVTIFFPLASCLLLSLVLTIVVNVIARLIGR